MAGAETVARPPAEEDDSDGGFEWFDADTVDTSEPTATTPAAEDPSADQLSADASTPGSREKALATNKRSPKGATGSKKSVVSKNAASKKPAPRGKARRRRAPVGDGSGDELGAEFDGGAASAAAVAKAAAAGVLGAEVEQEKGAPGSGRKPLADRPSLAARGFATGDGSRRGGGAPGTAT